ncbi:hypothetical protein FKW77_000518 [Venturia effusa]|uniref:Uncharacterized protein n=1 Tax=Venturia effusa TaxID=50376 RepID=A0A517LRD1_9PEZI|nr:hypothetical protein FKW77_000518 [Venturia effusa]
MGSVLSSFVSQPTIASSSTGFKRPSRDILDWPDDKLLSYVRRDYPLPPPHLKTVEDGCKVELTTTVVAFTPAELHKIMTQDQVYSMVRHYNPVPKNSENIGSLYLALFWLHRRGRVVGGIPVEYTACLDTTVKFGFGNNKPDGVLTFNRNWVDRFGQSFGLFGEGFPLAPPLSHQRYTYQRKNLFVVLSHLIETRTYFMDTFENGVKKCSSCIARGGPFSQDQHCVETRMSHFGLVGYHSRGDRRCTGCVLAGLVSILFDL